MLSERLIKLISDIATQLEKQERIFTTEWLRENHVAMSEIDAITVQLAPLIRAFLRLPVKVQAALFIIGQDEMKDVDASMLLAHALHDEVVNRLQK